MRVLSQWLTDRAVTRYATRASALARVVQALLTGGKLSLTHLGRNMAGEAKQKHQIKAVDRLLGNRHRHRSEMRSPSSGGQRAFGRWKQYISAGMQLLWLPAPSTEASLAKSLILHSERSARAAGVRSGGSRAA